MATYKIIQDIETEDKLIGPLTLRQFIYAGVCVLFGYFCFLSISKHAIFMLVIFFPIMALAGFFAFPWSNKQSTEVWALAKIRFMFKPHRRIWDQSGAKNLVTITAPKRPATPAARNLTQAEVHSRLKTLADTIDTRGWSTKDIGVNLSLSPFTDTLSPERLVQPTALSDESSDITAADDMLDVQSNATAQTFDRMINTAAESRRQQIKEKMQQVSVAPAGSNGQPEADKGLGYVTFDEKVISPHSQEASDQPTQEEKALSAELKAKRTKPYEIYNHLRVITPPDDARKSSLVKKAQVKARPASPSPVILNLAGTNDRTISSLASEANEVVVNLH